MARKLNDLTNRRYGRLLVIARHTEDYQYISNGKLRTHSLWLCLCDCGACVIVQASSLTHLGKISCGCTKPVVNNNSGRRAKDLTGVRFGKLLVVKRHPLNEITPNGTQRSRWIVVCDCGRYSVKAGYRLSNGSTKSCGKCSRSNILIGSIFCNLKVIDSLKGGYSLCKCSCGNLQKVNNHYLISGKINKCKQCNNKRSSTPEIRAMYTRNRKERKILLDSSWTHDMDICLRSLFTHCIICNSCDRLSIDHVLPLDKGYGLVPGNAVILCGHCNSSKGNRMLNELPTEWQHKLIDAAERFKKYWDMCLTSNES